MSTLIVITIAATLIFDFLNGFHDAANAIATVISTRVLKPIHAVAWSALFNFLAFFIFGVSVATTIGTGIVDPAAIQPIGIFCAMLAAITWNLATWYLGLPSSSSHALIGGLIGVGLARGGVAVLRWKGIVKILISIVLSPLLGMLLAMVLMTIVLMSLQNATPAPVDRTFRRIQLITSALLSLAHGGNDAQKSMGVIALLLYTSNQLGPTFYVPLWVVLSCYIAIALGTLFGGFRIIRTMGMKITKLKPVGGACAEITSAFTLFIATTLGIPVSTTHTITGAIVGVGALQRLSAVRWGVARRIVWAWIFTIPATTLLAMALLKLLQ